MKKIIVGLFSLASLLSLGYGAVFAQSLPTLGSAMTTSIISQPYQQSQCVEPDGSIVRVNRQFYLGDTYTTTDIVPRWGNGYDTLLLSASKVLIYNASMFNFTSTIQWKSNGVPSNAPVNNVVSAQGTFIVNSTSPGQLVYNIHRTALENKGSSTYNISYLGRTNLINYTAKLTNKTFHDKAGRVVNGYECVNYTVHYCGDGVVDTKQSIANLPGGFANSIANEECDGTAGVPSGYTCTSSCKLQQQEAKPTCTLSVSSGSVELGTPIQASWTINGNYTNTPQITYTPTTRNITGLPYTVTTAAGQRTITAQHIGTFTLSMTVSNTAGQSVCTAPFEVHAPKQQLKCTLNLSPNPISVNQVATVRWNVTGGNFVGTYIYVQPSLAGARPHRINANEYSGTTSAIPTQTGDYLFTLMVSNNESSAICTGILSVGPNQAKLSLKKTLINNILYQSGDLVSFIVDFANIGNTTTHNNILTDYLPAGLEFVSSQIFGINQPYYIATGSVSGNQYIEYYGFTLVPGQKGYMTITGKFKGYDRSNQTLNNAFLDSDETDILHDSALFYVFRPTDAIATITKSADKYSYTLGENVKFSIAVTNKGPDTITQVQIIDTWPNTSCLTIDNTWTSNMPLTMTTNTNPYVRTLPSLSVGQIINLYLLGHIKNDPTCAGTYTNLVDLRYTVNGQIKTGHAQATITVTPPSTDIAKCDSLRIDGNGSSIAIIEDGRAKKNFTCTTNGIAAKNVSLDCGNGDVLKLSNPIGSSFQKTCTYTEQGPYLVNCSVDNATVPPACMQHIIVDEGHNPGFCGDGIRESDEKCDDGDRNGTMLSNCTDECELKSQSNITACFNIGNTSISIQNGEKLPFRWTLDYKKNIINGNSCVDEQDGKIPEDSIYCTFKVYNGAHKEIDKDPVYTIKKKCNEDNRANYPLFQYFLNQGWRSLQNAFGKYYLDSNDFVKDNVFGEYKIVLDRVTYQYCSDEAKIDGPEVDRVCTVDFTVTQPYLAQKSAFGLTPKATTIPLKGYKMIDGTNLIDSTDLADIMVINPSAYQGGTKVQTMINTFITKYDKLALTVPKSSLGGTVFENMNTNITVKIVPKQKIYILQAAQAGTKFVMDQINTFTAPFTIVTKNIDLVIKGNVDYNGMFLVKDGTIAFDKADTVSSGDRCPTTQTVKGIFVTTKGFVKANTPSLNNVATNMLRCNYGGLYVKGILIGNTIDNIVESKRSQLNHRFYAGGSSPAAIKAERRNEIFKGASVLIEYSPSLWNALPPGASDFTKALDIYKQ